MDLDRSRGFLEDVEVTHGHGVQVVDAEYLPFRVVQAPGGPVGHADTDHDKSRKLVFKTSFFSDELDYNLIFNRRGRHRLLRAI